MHENFGDKLKERKELKDLVIEERIQLKRLLKACNWRIWLAFVR
jgi:hypothetical protein